MKILIFGGQGMAGHMVADYLSERTSHDVFATVRRECSSPRHIMLDVRYEQEMVNVLTEVRPDVLINAVGLLNDHAADRLADAIAINSLLPHKLARLGEQFGFRLIHISTDCVFSGSKGDYTETDTADGLSAYAKSKSLGEIAHGNHLTIRTSIIGPELKDGIGLFHWFMRQQGEIWGYRQVFWNGVTTLELAKVIEWLLPRKLSGIIHLGARKKVSKYDLLLLLKEVFQREHLMIKPFDGIASDKSLVNTRKDVTYTVPSYPLMLSELRQWIKTHQRYDYS